jgi:hypothetical protein
MKAVLMFVVVGIGAVTCAVVFAQSGPEQAKKAVAPAQPNVISPLLPGESFQDTRGFVLGLEPNLQDQSYQLVQQYVKAEKEEDKKEIRKKLADALGKQFDTHMELQQKELADLERQMAELQNLLKKRQKAKSEIIDRRMDQLIQDAEGLGWTAPGSPHQPRALWQQASPYYRSSSAVGRPYGETKAEAKRP